ncbi:hypothetical protein F5144DRAFT_558707 [Chaetomium tenue]|uniref:Uncharacterized protein n=1 Tax=Chaetomium tenue TaxID=1854479 RepID=A0ACB7PPQ3_9PEZI|nr:hypothetical protein F5144DRAFT_558707 [Chaetomium globosum]
MARRQCHTHNQPVIVLIFCQLPSTESATSHRHSTPPRTAFRHEQQTSSVPCQLTHTSTSNASPNGTLRGNISRPYPPLPIHEPTTTVHAKYIRYIHGTSLGKHRQGKPKKARVISANPSHTLRSPDAGRSHNLEGNPAGSTPPKGRSSINKGGDMAAWGGGVKVKSRRTEPNQQHEADPP